MKDKALLNFDFIPYWSIPFRFFLTAPLFSIVAGIVLIILGADALVTADGFLWQSRWFTYVIYTLHLVTLGTVTMVMAGALYQVTSVVGGSLLPGGKSAVAVIHGCLVVGVSFFLLAMLAQKPWMFAVAALTLVTGLLLLAVCGLTAIGRAHRTSATLLSMKLALISLVATLAMGVTLLLMHGYPELLGFDRRWTDIHLVWALAGWVGLLIVGVSFQVIPMFHVTPSFNVPFERWMPIAIFLMMLLFSVCQLFIPESGIPIIAKALLLFCYGVYGAAVLSVLAKRKRKIQDITVLFWRVAAICLLIFVLIQLFIEIGITGEFVEKIWILGGVLLIYGGVLSVIEGMLLKIVPFLSYLHMQRFCKGDFNAMKSLPHMRMILKAQHAKVLFRLHLLTLSLLLLMVFVPTITLLAGVSMLVEFSLLFFVTARVVKMIRRIESERRLTRDN